jgi:hypothetical protein
VVLVSVMVVAAVVTEKGAKGAVIMMRISLLHRRQQRAQEGKEGASQSERGPLMIDFLSSPQPRNQCC